MIDKRYLGVLFMLLGTALIVLGFLIEFYNLKQFKKCYNIEFNSTYCEKYKNY